MSDFGRIDTAPEPILALACVSFAYPGRRHTVLDRVDLAVTPGQRIGCIGPNGSGKTTLFHVIMGLCRPGSGEVLFRGRVMRGEKDFRELRRSVGLLFQDADDQLFSPTVLEDVAFGPLNLGMTPFRARERALQTLATLGLTELADRVTHQLSGGEKKLVSLATLLSMEPQVLLLDEPTNTLDAATRSRLIRIINSLPQTLLIISHDWDFLAVTTREILTLENGSLSRSGTSVLHRHSHIHPQGAQPHHHGAD